MNTNNDSIFSSASKVGSEPLQCSTISTIDLTSSKADSNDCGMYTMVIPHFNSSTAMHSFFTCAHLKHLPTVSVSHMITPKKGPLYKKKKN